MKTFDVWWWERCIEPGFRHNNAGDKSICREAWFEAYRLGSLENERLREALKPFAAVASLIPKSFEDGNCWHRDHLARDYRAARQACGEGEDDGAPRCD